MHPKILTKKQQIQLTWKFCISASVWVGAVRAAAVVTAAGVDDSGDRKDSEGNAEDDSQGRGYQKEDDAVNVLEMY